MIKTTISMEKYCISIDWLQSYCLCNKIQEGIYASRGYEFRVTVSKTETPQFKHILNVYLDGRKCAVIQQCPRTSVINSKATLVKLDNRVLYSQQYINVLYAIHESMGMKYKGLTRVDICYDCNRFYGGRSVERFIHKFANGIAGKTGEIVRKGSDEFTLHGKKKQSSAIKYNSIRFGKGTGRVSSYIYNKTLELKEVKDKPWIREMWERNELQSTENTPVWRCEISIKSQGMDILSMDSGELFRLSPRYLEHANSINRMFYVFAEKYFNFSVSTGQKNRRNYKRIQLFENLKKITEKPIYINRLADTGRIEKVCYNKLDRLSKEYSNLSGEFTTALHGAMEFLQYVSGVKAGKIRMERYTKYLDSLMGRKFIESEDKAYWGALESLWEKKREFDPEFLYELTYDNVKGTERQIHADHLWDTLISTGDVFTL